MSTLLRVDHPIGTYVSTYTGAGGMDIGFAGAGFEPIWANDIDPAAVETYNKLFDQHVGVEGDIRSQDLPKEGAADLVIGGPPCQGFSVAGHMDPNDPRSRHVFDFLGVVARVRPAVFVMENVKALYISRRWSQIREELTHAAQGMGYQTQMILLNASHFGVPQARERMFFIGRRGGDPIAPIPVSAGVAPTARQALESLPSYGEPGNDTICKAVITPARKPILRRSPYAGMLFNGQGRPLNLDRPASTLPASMGGNRTPIIDQHEFDTGEPSWILDYHAHLWGGGAPYETAPRRLRRITVEEAAALQTFPQGIRWAGSQNAAYRQIGNAVPPVLAYHVARAVATSQGLKPQETPSGIKGYTGEAHLLADISEVLPDGEQLTLDIREAVSAYSADGDSRHLAQAIESLKSA